jgi:hypothetical protein
VPDQFTLKSENCPQYIPSSFLCSAAMVTGECAGANLWQDVFGEKKSTVVACKREGLEVNLVAEQLPASLFG